MEYEIRNYHRPSPGAPPDRTLVVRVVDSVAYAGLAYCSHLDKPSKKVGLSIAKNRCETVQRKAMKYGYPFLLKKKDGKNILGAAFLVDGEGRRREVVNQALSMLGLPQLPELPPPSEASAALPAAS